MLFIHCYCCFWYQQNKVDWIRFSLTGSLVNWRWIGSHPATLCLLTSHWLDLTLGICVFNRRFCATKWPTISGISIGFRLISISTGDELAIRPNCPSISRGDWLWFRSDGLKSSNSLTTSSVEWTDFLTVFDRWVAQLRNEVNYGTFGSLGGFLSGAGWRRFKLVDGTDFWIVIPAGSHRKCWWKKWPTSGTSST